MEISIPKEVGIILNKLKSSGFEAFIVGGCVRDSLMGKTPKDWDIAVNSTPQETVDVFEKAGFKTVPTGIKHGTVTVMIEKVPYEVTTFRIDQNYIDGRRPENVMFTTSITEDLSRRDFTINAMAYNELNGLIDPFDGQNDLKKKIIKCVGDPDKRFGEDALRMLRAVRFSAQLDFNIDEDTYSAISKNSGLVSKISWERIRDEFNKILLSKPFKIKTLKELGILNQILPEFSECFHVSQENIYHVYNVEDHILKSVESIETDLVLRLTMFFHDIGKPLCKTIDVNGKGHFYGHDQISSAIAFERLKIMKYDNSSVEKVSKLIKYHDQRIGDSHKSVRKWLKNLGFEMLMNLIKVKEADIKAQNPIFYKERFENLQRIKKIAKDIVQKNECFEIKDLAINGADLLDAGFCEGPQIGTVLNELLDLVIENPGNNTKEILIKLAKEM
jgi:tRNA nucleotidyltransferase (CCA-adding enzyme)